MFRALPLVLLPAVVFAQTSLTEPLVIQVNGVTDVTVFPEMCTGSVAGKWFSQVQQPACDPLKLWATSGECGDGPAAADVRFNDVPVNLLAAGSGDFSIKVSALPGFKDAATPCGGGPYELTHKICGAIGVSTGFDCTFTTTRSQVRAKPASLVYDTLPPNPPTLEAVNAFDKALQVYFTAGDDAVAVEVWIRVVGDADFGFAGDFATSAGSARIERLTNGVEYEVMLFALDAAGNASDGSAALTATPHLTNGFWAAYQTGGGGDRGCGSSSAGAGAPLWWLALWALSSRRKR